MPRPLRRKMKPQIREIVDWAEANGWQVNGKDGRGHWVLEHPSAGTVRLPDTPSEWRGLRNAKAEIRRKSNIPSASGPAGRYRHEARRDGFDMDAALKERRMRQAYREASAQRLRRLRLDLARAHEELDMVDPRRYPDAARAAASKVIEIQSQIDKAEQDAP